MNTFKKYTPLVLLALPALEASAQKQATSSDILAGYSYYQQYCSGCHGRSMEGGSASSLIEDNWAWGSSRDEIYNSISEGNDQFGMPAYGETMTSEQIYQLTDLILSGKVPKQPNRTAPKNSDVIKTMDYEIALEDWVTGVKTPWHLEFVNENTALLTEKPGPLRVIHNGELGPPVEDTPKVNSEGQGGMLAVNVHPDFAENGWVYLAYSHPLEKDPKMVFTRVVRGKIVKNQWQNQETIWQSDDKHYNWSRHHYGTRIQFGPDGMLYFPIGERGAQNRAQDLGDPAGKMHRIFPDGRIPKDNPFVNRDGAVKSIWSYGHRNPQGFDFHPITNDIWEAEHGPRGGDEMNIVKKAVNYGWPEITYGINYNGSVITKERVRPGLEQPVWVWRPSIAVCGIEFYEGNEFPFWRNHLMVTSLANQTVRLMQIQNDRIIHEEVIFKDRGRIRHATQDADGAIYVVLNGPDKVVKLTAIKENMK